ncbi:MAG: GAF domain-containing protein [Bryobacterales bacterium]|nr:GAF domain-containing protein [Bryobacterales bacterium]
MAFLEELDSALAAPHPIERALALTIEHLRAESGAIHLLADDGVLHLKASQGIPDVVLQIVQRVPVGKGMAGLAVERAQPVNACNIQTDTTGDVRPGARKTGMEGAIVVPIMKGDRATGALGVANRSERTFTDEEIATLIEAGRRIARLS